MTEPPVGATATIIFLCAMVGLLRDLIENAFRRHETSLFGVDPWGSVPVLVEKDDGAVARRRPYAELLAGATALRAPRFAKREAGYLSI